MTRLRSLREAERFVRAGIPLVASLRFGAGKLSGSPIRATNGHIMVIVGFTDNGDVVVNDPAARNGGGVVRTYERGKFENAWIPSPAAWCTSSTTTTSRCRGPAPGTGEPAGGGPRSAGAGLRLEQHRPRRVLA